MDVQYLAARSYVLARIGRLDEAAAAAEQEAALAERLGIPALEATAEHDRGMVALARGEHADAAALLEAALDHGAPVSRPLARLARAEALVHAGRLDEAETELRETALEPVAPSDFPDTLVPRLVRVQGLIAAARGDDALAARRFEEAAAGWRRRLGHDTDGERYTAVLADLGRPPVAGLVEPERELERVLHDLRALAPASA
jgi:tetratricopeptide (TPR) repeat protein